MGSSKTKTAGPVVPMTTTEESIMESNLAARDALRRNVMRRGVWNTIKNAGGFRGDQSAANVRTGSLIGEAGTVPEAATDSMLDIGKQVPGKPKKDENKLPVTSPWRAGVLNLTKRSAIGS